MRTLRFAAAVLAVSLSTGAYAQGCRSSDGGYCLKTAKDHIILVDDMGQVSDTSSLDKRLEAVSQKIDDHLLAQSGQVDATKAAVKLEMAAKEQSEIGKADAKRISSFVQKAVDRAMQVWLREDSPWKAQLKADEDRKQLDKEPMKSSSDPLGLEHSDQRGYPCLGAKSLNSKLDSFKKM